MFRYEERGVLCSGMKREVWCVQVRRERCVVFRFEERDILCSGMKREVCCCIQV